MLNKSFSKLTSLLTSAIVAGLFAVSATADPVVYEPFDYPAGGLNGQSGSSEIGLDATWTANSTSTVTAGSLTYGKLARVGTGNSIAIPAGGLNRFGGARTVSASALAGNGLLDDGATLWFSLLMGYNNGNGTNTTLAFALANDQFTGGNYSYQINDDGAQLGRGVGVFMGRDGSTNGTLRAAEFQDSSFGGGFNGIVYGSNLAGAILGNPDYTLVVGKITWGAVADTIELYNPDLALNQGSLISTLTISVDQSTFDTITWERGEGVLMDEIRFGATYADVTVPEPSSLLLLGLADLGLSFRQGRN